MKKPASFLLALLVFLTACNGTSTEEVTVTQNGDTVSAATAVEPERHTDLYGTYTGPFMTVSETMGDGDYLDDVAPISISLTRITDKGAVGKSVLKGKVRPFSGKYTQTGTGVRFTVDEPGDDKYDGRFEFTVAGDSLVGNWRMYDPNLPRPYKEYTLHKKAFVYNPNLMLSPVSEDGPDDDNVDYITHRTEKILYTLEDGTIDTMTQEFYRQASDVIYKLNGSRQAFTEKQLKNLCKLDLEILRNSIFARHGFSFSKKSVRQFFESTDWYMPVSANVDAELTELERQNITLLKRFEQYATDHYDTFGR